jgi:hypothetical protein
VGSDRLESYSSLVDSGVGGRCWVGRVNGHEAISLPSGSEMRRKSSRTVGGIKLVERRCAVDCVLVRAYVAGRAPNSLVLTDLGFAAATL